MKPIVIRRERWLPVVGYEGCYEVSSYGRVASIRCRGKVRRIILKPAPRSSLSDHLSVNLCRHGKGCSRQVHHLVLEAFVGPRPVGLKGLHSNGIATDNSFSNLYYGTQKQNMADARMHGTWAHGETCGHAKVTEAQVFDIRNRWAVGETSEALAREYGMRGSAVRRICNGTRWGHI